MGTEFNFLHDDVFLSSIDHSKSFMNSDNATDILSENLFLDDLLCNFDGAGFDPDQFLNDSQHILLQQKQTLPNHNDKFSAINCQLASGTTSNNSSPPSSHSGDSDLVLLSDSTFKLDVKNFDTEWLQKNFCGVNTNSDRDIAANDLNPSTFGDQGNVLNNSSFDKSFETFTNLCPENVGQPEKTKPSCIQQLNEKLIRKHQRMIRNRESAYLSRKKKKEYVCSLESKVAVLREKTIQLETEVHNLRNELSRIRNICTCGSKEFLTNRKGFSSHVKKNTAVLLAMVFMVSLNFGKFHSFLSPDVPFQQSPASLQDSNNTKVFTRKLLWLNDSIENDDLPNLTENCNESFSQINQTENLRLTTELRKLVGSQKNVKQDYFGENFNPTHFFPLKSSRYVDDIVKIPTYDSEKTKYSKLFQKIHRKNDTFYILSLNSENILLPAALYNESSRPKMSLMLPTRDFMGNKKIAFMQIDCEVLNTSTIKLKDIYLPSSVRNQLKQNVSVENKGTEASKDKQKLNQYGFALKEYNKKAVYKSHGSRNRQNRRGIVDIPSFFPFPFN